MIDGKKDALYAGLQRVAGLRCSSVHPAQGARQRQLQSVVRSISCARGVAGLQIERFLVAAGPRAQRLQSVCSSRRPPFFRVDGTGGRAGSIDAVQRTRYARRKPFSRRRTAPSRASTSMTAQRRPRREARVGPRPPGQLRAPERRQVRYRRGRLPASRSALFSALHGQRQGRPLRAPGGVRAPGIDRHRQALDAVRLAAAIQAGQPCTAA